MSKNVLSNDAYSPTAATSRRASSWVLIDLLALEGAGA